jgi:hypothetical protein
LHRDKELYAEETPPFIDIAPFGNLELKYGFILTRLNLLNEKIIEIHQCHEENIDKRNSRK